MYVLKQLQIHGVFNLLLMKPHYPDGAEFQKQKNPTSLRRNGIYTSKRHTPPKGLWLMELRLAHIFSANTTKLRENVKANLANLQMESGARLATLMERGWGEGEEGSGKRGRP